MLHVPNKLDQMFDRAVPYNSVYTGITRNETFLSFLKIDCWIGSYVVFGKIIKSVHTR
jgi:hypothetical protein